MKATSKVRVQDVARITILGIEAGKLFRVPRVKIQYILGNDAPVTRWFNVDETFVIDHVNLDFSIE